MKKSKIVLSLASLSLVAAVAVGGTLAWMTDSTQIATNTFNIGSGFADDGTHKGLWLDETKIGGTSEEPENPAHPDQNPNNRTEEDQTYEGLRPNSTFAKDPTFHITEGSIPCYVIARIQNGDKATAAGYIFKAEDTSTETTLTANWKKVAGDNGKDDAQSMLGLDGYYIYVDKTTQEPLILDPSEATDDLTLEPLFRYTTLTIDISTEEELDKADGQKIKISGAAVQAQNATWEEAVEQAITTLG